MAQEFGTEIEKLLYETLIGDGVLATLLGGDGVDPRIYLSWRAESRPRISDSLQGYVVIRFDSAEEPSALSETVDDRRERYLLSIFSLPEAREFRGEVMMRFRELFHRKSFVTESFLVYDVGEIAGEEHMMDNRLMELRYILSCGFLPR